MVSAVHAGSNRMGVIRKQDEAISSEQILALIETGESVGAGSMSADSQER